MQDKIFNQVKIFEVTHKSVKVFSLEIFRLYGIYPYGNLPLIPSDLLLQDFFLAVPGEAGNSHGSIS